MSLFLPSGGCLAGSIASWESLILIWSRLLLWVSFLPPTSFSSLLIPSGSACFLLRLDYLLIGSSFLGGLLATSLVIGISDLPLFGAFWVWGSFFAFNSPLCVIARGLVVSFFFKGGFCSPLGVIARSLLPLFFLLFSFSSLRFLSFWIYYLSFYVT